MKLVISTTLLTVVAGQLVTSSPESAATIIEGEKAQSESQAKTKIRKLIDRSAAAYTFFSDSDRTKPMKLRPVLRWTNNVRGSADGATFIWIANGRPEATACVYPWHGSICDNFQSLSTRRFFAERDGKRVWSPQGPGVTFQSFPDAPAPAESSAKRLRQMKMFAGRFSLTLLGWAADNSDREELRLLTRPLYRYESRDPELLDGAIFAFVQGTDPETFLLIEAARIEGTYKWQYALARRTSGSLNARYRNKIVWEVPKEGDWKDPQKPHFQFARKFE